MASRPFFIALLPLLPLLVACSANETSSNTGGAGGGGGGGSGGGGAGGSGGGGVTCPPDPNWNGAMPVVSLKNDLLADSSTQKPGCGVFRRACSASSCHDDQRPEASLFIAPPLRDVMTQMPIALTPDHVTRLLGMTDGVLRMSQTAPTMALVDPGKPATSFLMRKMDGCFTDLASGNQCIPIGDGPPPCGDEMPSGADVLDSTERDMVRRWIFQGAQNN